MRNAIPSTDLSQVRIEGRTLDKRPADTDPAGQGNPPVDIIEWRLSTESLWGYSPMADPWSRVTIGEKPLSGFEDAAEILGNNFITVESGRSSPKHSVFIDREHDLELRFIYNTEEVLYLKLMRIDNRTSKEYRREISALSAEAFGPQLFHSLDILSINDCILYYFEKKDFLPVTKEYFQIPMYYAVWMFPLVCAIYKRRVRWFAAIAVWYPIWFGFCLFTMLAQQ